MNWTQTVFVPAYAKINLSLEILHRRDDGYHDIASVMQTISLCDTLAFRPAPGGIRTLACDVPELEGRHNLALRAADLLAAETGHEPGVAIELHKETPAQGGLGGGSSDAARTLVALSRLWGIHAPQQRLHELAASLGSDVPFFLVGGTALIEGRGERVTPLPDAEPLWLVLATPPVGVATRAAYAALGPESFSDGASTVALRDVIQRGEPLPLDLLTNGFEPSVLRDHRAIEQNRRALLSAGAPLVRLSGSGPSLYAPFRSLIQAAAVWRRMLADSHTARLACTVTRAEVERSAPS
jgi:4-diphosphocytidyl-2-C-methyl-D-erythritol kinase